MKFSQVLIALLALSMFGLATPTPSKKKVTGTVGYIDNPYQYMYGVATNAYVFELNKRVYTTLQMNPTFTYSTFVQFVTFCGDQSEMLDFTTKDVVVLVYSRTLTHQLCHTLYRVDVIDKTHSGREGK